MQTSANYTHRENETETSDEVVASSNVEIEHGANFRSTWDFNFDHFQSPDFQSDNYAGVATLHHQLYQSLNSALSLNASDFEVSGASGEGFVRHFGIAWGEIYTKHLAQDHRLRINNPLAVDHTEEQNLNQVENERHTFGAGGGGAPPDSFFLNLPNVLEFTIVVTDQNDSQPAYVEGADYLVSRQGVLTLIERTGTSRIPAGSSVLLDYRAEPRPAASYETISESFGVRLDLWKNLWGIYANVSRSENNAPAAAVALEVTSYTAGTDVHWRWLNAGAEYNIYDSDQSQFRSARLFQNFNFRPDEASTLAMNFSQAFTEFVDSHREEEDYRFITRYRRFFQRNLGLNVEGGVDFRKGTGVDQTLATARADLNYTVGRTTMKVAYDYEYSLFLDSDERSRHMLTFRVKRVF